MGNGISGSDRLVWKSAAGHCPVPHFLLPCMGNGVQDTGHTAGYIGIIRSAAASACLENRLCHLQFSPSVRIAPNSGYIARYAPFIWHMAAKSIFQTRVNLSFFQPASLSPPLTNIRKRNFPVYRRSQNISVPVV